MEYGQLFKNAFDYARHSSAVTAFVAFMGVMGLAFVAIWALLLRSVNWTGGINAIIQSAPSIGLGIFASVLLLVIAMLGMVALNAAVIRNASTRETLSQSLHQIKPRMLSLVGLAILTTIISFAFSALFSILKLAFVPALMLFVVLEMLVSLVLAVSLAFAEFALVLESRAVLDSLSRSVRLSLDKPIEVIITILLAIIVAICMGLVLVGLIAALALLGALLLGANVFTGGIALVLGLLVIGAFGLVGFAIIQVVNIHYMTHAFMELAAIHAPKPSATLTHAPIARPRKVTHAKPARKPAAKKPAVRKPPARKKR